MEVRCALCYFKIMCLLTTIAGHFVPSKGPWRKFLVNWMKDPSASLAPPGAAAASVDSSGMSTPVPGEAGQAAGNAVLMKL